MLYVNSNLILDAFIKTLILITGIEWNNPQNNPGGSSHYPGNNHHNNGHPGGSSHNRGKRTPEDAPWLRPHNSNKPNYKNGVLDWNNR